MKAWRMYLFGVLPFGPWWGFQPNPRKDLRRPFRWLPCSVRERHNDA